MFQVKMRPEEGVSFVFTACGKRNCQMFPPDMWKSPFCGVLIDKNRIALPENHFKLYPSVGESLKTHLSLWAAAVIFERLSSSASAGVAPPPLRDVYTELAAASLSRTSSCNYRICCLNAANRLEATATRQVFSLLEQITALAQHGQSGSGSGLDFRAECSASFCGLQPWCLACALGSVHSTGSADPRLQQGGKLASMTQPSIFFHHPHLSEPDTEQNRGCWWWNILSIPPPTHPPEIHTMSSLLAIYFCSASDRHINQSWLCKARLGGLWCTSKTVWPWFPQFYLLALHESSKFWCTAIFLNKRELFYPLWAEFN